MALAGCGTSQAAPGAMSPLNTNNFLPCYFFDRLVNDPKYESTAAAQVDQTFAIANGLKAADPAIRKAAFHWKRVRARGEGNDAQLKAFVAFAVACHSLHIGPGDM